MIFKFYNFLYKSPSYFCKFYLYFNLLLLMLPPVIYIFYNINFNSTSNTFFYCFSNRLYILEQFWVHSKTERKVQRFPLFSCPTPASLPLYQSPHPLEGCNCYNWWTYTSSSPDTIVCIVYILVLYILWVWTNV